MPLWVRLADAGIKTGSQLTSSQNYMKNWLTVTRYEVANALSDTILPMGHDYLRLCFVTLRGWP
jgi:hypothetical protein